MPEFLPIREAFADTAHIRSEEVFVGADRTPPRLTIALPTCRRHDLLVEAVASALSQDWKEPFEVMVVDDDPAGDGCARLRSALPAVDTANFRYLRNRRNLGMYPNHNRCVTEARGAWISILHDDDLLDPDFTDGTFTTAVGTGPISIVAGARGRYVINAVERNILDGNLYVRITKTAVDQWSEGVLLFDYHPYMGA